MIFGWSGPGEVTVHFPSPSFENTCSIMKDIIEKLMASKGFFPPICFIDRLLNLLFLEYPNIIEGWNCFISISSASLEWNDKWRVLQIEMPRASWNPIYFKFSDSHSSRFSSSMLWGVLSLFFRWGVGALRLSNLPKDSQMESGRVRIWTYRTQC